MRYCKNHGEQPLENFIQEKNKKAKSGFQFRCKLCKKEKDFRYREPRRKELSEKTGIYKKNNREKINEWNRNDRKKKPELYAAALKRQRVKLGAFRNVIEISRTRGITTDKYQQMLKDQDYKCAICLQPERRKSRNGKISQLCLDHNHLTNSVRQFLCHDCNTMLGKFCESKEIMESAINYLTIHGALCQK